MFLSRRHFLRTVIVLIGVLAAVAAMPAASAYLEGIDASHYQGTINWTSVRNSGRVFAIVKATEGTTYTDPTFATNWTRMKQAGLIRGAYHFGHPGSDAVAQANRFVNVVQPQSGDLQLVLDLEVTDGRSPAQVWAWTQAFIAQIHTRTGRPGIIYTGFYFWRDSVGNPPNNLNCPLWLAAYTSSTTGLVPRAWTTWSFWQYTDHGSVPGVSGNVDLDHFNGSLTQLKALTLP
jgi:GH25 family lysozyme M1 (1,4-beta-N-acetylmuramidase)